MAEFRLGRKQAEPTGAVGLYENPNGAVRIGNHRIVTGLDLIERLVTRRPARPIP
jgi:hypothetical protein